MELFAICFDAVDPAGRPPTEQPKRSPPSRQRKSERTAFLLHSDETLPAISRRHTIGWFASEGNEHDAENRLGALPATSAMKADFVLDPGRFRTKLPGETAAQSPQSGWG